MKIERMKELIKEAEKIVEDMSDRELKIKAFGVTYDYLLRESVDLQKDTKKSSNCTEKQISKEENNSSVVEGLVSGCIEQMAKKASVSTDTVENIFSIKENSIDINVEIKGEDEREKQLTATLLYLTAYNFCYDLREIDSSELREKLDKKLLIGNLVNLSTNLKNRSDLIIHKRGVRGSTKTAYRITTKGIKEGLNVIKKIGEEYEN